MVRAAIFGLVLLAGAVAPVATRSLTCRFLARFLLDVIALCVTPGNSFPCTLGAGRASLVITCVCLIDSWSASISGTVRCVRMLLLGRNGFVLCGEWSSLLRLMIAPCATALLVSCCNYSN